MKRFIAIVLITISTLSMFAQAAVDPVDVINKLWEINTAVDKMIVVVDLWKDGQIEVEGEVLVFDTTFKNQLKQKFLSLKAQFDTKCDELNTIIGQ